MAGAWGTRGRVVSAAVFALLFFIFARDARAAETAIAAQYDSSTVSATDSFAWSQYLGNELEGQINRAELMLNFRPWSSNSLLQIVLCETIPENEFSLWQRCIKEMFVAPIVLAPEERGVRTKVVIDLPEPITLTRGTHYNLLVQCLGEHSLCLFYGSPDESSYSQGSLRKDIFGCPNRCPSEDPVIKDAYFELKLVSERTPVVIVPGIMGSTLYRNSDLYWLDLQRMFFDINDQFVSEGLLLDALGKSSSGILVGEVLEKIVDLPLLNVNIFEGLRLALQDANYAMNQDLFFFPYDWRLNLDSTKDLLKAKIDEVKAQTGASRVNIIAHSMGGLLVKDYIHAFGKDSIEKLIFIGTPHLGAPKAAKVLLEGDRFGIPWLEEDRIQEISRNSPAVYELLPHQKYFDVFSGYIKKYSLFFLGDFLNYQGTKDFLLGEGLNGAVFGQAETLFGKNLHDIDLSGIDAYNIAGCRTATQAGYQLRLLTDSIGHVGYASGDETVPLASADYLNTSSTKKFYMKDGVHSELPSMVPVRDAILDILAGNPVENSSELSANSLFCGFRGKTLAWRSPVEVHVYDGANRHTGPIEENGIEYGVPGVQYDIIGEEKFVFLPTDTGEEYRVVGRGLASSTFDLLVAEAEDGIPGAASVFNDIAITPSSSIQIDISATSTEEILLLDRENSGQFEEVPASAMLSGAASEDLAPPETSLRASGIPGANGWYLSGVSVELAATDTESGVSEIRYSLDGGESYEAYTSTIAIHREGITPLHYFAIDRAGNNEPVHGVDVKVDKSPPEFTAQFDLLGRTFAVSATDTIDTLLDFACYASLCSAADDAGNASLFSFEHEGKSDKYIFVPQSISYNSINHDFSDHFLIVKHKVERGLLKNFDQTFFIGDEKIAGIHYISDRDESRVSSRLSEGGFLKQVLPGKVFLRLETNGGSIKSDVILQ